MLEDTEMLWDIVMPGNMPTEGCDHIWDRVNLWGIVTLWGIVDMMIPVNMVILGTYRCDRLAGTGDMITPTNTAVLGTLWCFLSLWVHQQRL